MSLCKKEYWSYKQQTLKKKTTNTQGIKHKIEAGGGAGAQTNCSV